MFLPKCVMTARFTTSNSQQVTFRIISRFALVTTRPPIRLKLPQAFLNDLPESRLSRNSETDRVPWWSKLPQTPFPGTCRVAVPNHRSEEPNTLDCPESYSGPLWARQYN